MKKSIILILLFLSCQTSKTLRIEPNMQKNKMSSKKRIEQLIEIYKGYYLPIPHSKSRPVYLKFPDGKRCIAFSTEISNEEKQYLIGFSLFKPSDNFDVEYITSNVSNGLGDSALFYQYNDLYKISVIDTDLALSCQLGVKGFYKLARLCYERHKRFMHKDDFAKIAWLYWSGQVIVPEKTKNEVFRILKEKNYKEVVLDMITKLRLDDNLIASFWDNMEVKLCLMVIVINEKELWQRFYDATVLAPSLYKFRIISILNNDMVTQDSKKMRIDFLKQYLNDNSKIQMKSYKDKGLLFNKYPFITFPVKYFAAAKMASILSKGRYIKLDLDCKIIDKYVNNVNKTPYKEKDSTIGIILLDNK